MVAYHNSRRFHQEKTLIRVNTFGGVEMKLSHTSTPPGVIFVLEIIPKFENELQRTIFI